MPVSYTAKCVHVIHLTPYVMYTHAHTSTHTYIKCHIVYGNRSRSRSL